LALAVNRHSGDRLPTPGCENPGHGWARRFRQTQIDVRRPGAFSVSIESDAMPKTGVSANRPVRRSPDERSDIRVQQIQSKPRISLRSSGLRLLADLRAPRPLHRRHHHDLRVAPQICDLDAVMKDGEEVEHGLAADVLGRPQSLLA